MPHPRVRHHAPGQFQAAVATALEDLDQVVKVLPLPIDPPAELSAGVIQEMESLREAGNLTSLRGGRPTDLPRPLPEALRSHIKSQCPHLVELLHQVEALLVGSHLFVRAVKIDAPRASSTSPDGDPCQENLHLDAYKSSLADYAEPVYQFYLNAGQQPRQFRILPVPLTEILNTLVAEGHTSQEEARTTPVGKLLTTYLKTRTEPASIETIPIPCATLAIFDGRTFPHDAGKGDPTALAQGTFRPVQEPDLVLALDTKATGYHEGFYDPELGLLEDGGG